jgi:hypothetical protein
MEKGFPCPFNGVIIGNALGDVKKILAGCRKQIICVVVITEN